MNTNQQTIDTSLAKKLDCVLTKMDALQRRLDKLEMRSGDQNAKLPSSACVTGIELSRPPPLYPQRESYFKGNCYRCGQQGHVRAVCPLNYSKPM